MPDYIETRTILSKLRHTPDPYFGITYTMNLYRGCQHQCIYCDSRSKVYGIDDFSKIRVKRNAIELLEKTLRKRIMKGTIGTGSMNDPYMPVERTEKLTYSALKTIATYHFPVHILTKSDLVTRDVDILKDIALTYAAVSFTITTYDDHLSQIIEPGAVTSGRRFNAMEAIAKAGLYTGIILSPVLPFITDTEDNIENIIKLAADHGASYIIGWMGMTQREGQREYFYTKLDQFFPGLRDRYTNQFKLSYECPSPSYLKLYEVYNETCERVHLDKKIRFFIESQPVQLDLFSPHKSILD